MGLFNRSQPTYDVKEMCTNCNRETILKVPNGIPVREHICSGNAICNFCGCSIVKVTRPQVPNPQQLPPQELPPLPTPPKARGRKKKEPEDEVVEEPARDYGNYPSLDDGSGVVVEPW